MQVFQLMAMFFLLSFTAGCAGGLGVYESDFSCPNSYNGRCISMQGAYDAAVSGQDSADYDPAVIKKKKEMEEESGEKTSGNQVSENVMDPRVGEQNAYSAYKESLYNKFSSLIQTSVTPMVAPPKVMKVLLLPYRGEGNELFMLREVFFFVDEPKWILGDTVVELEEE